MKCDICKRKTSWNTSVGYDEFIVCNGCFSALEKECPNNILALNFIWKCGKLRKAAYDERNARVMQKGKK